MSGGSQARARLIARARQELPEPRDPRALIEDLAEIEPDAGEALEVLARTSLAWRQLHELRLERAWQNGFGWFLARNLMVLAALALVLGLTLRPPPIILEAFLAGAGGFYVIVLLIGPLRLRGHRARREGILASYGRDLSAYLASIER